MTKALALLVLLHCKEINHCAEILVLAWQGEAKSAAAGHLIKGDASTAVLMGRGRAMLNNLLAVRSCQVL